MPLKTYDTKESVPDAQRDSAVETKDGKWVAELPSTEIGDAGKEAIRREREKAKAEKDRADAAEKELADRKLKDDARDKGVSTEALQKIQADADAKVAKEKELREKAEAETKKVKSVDQVKALGLKHGWLSDRVEKAMKDLDGRYDLADDGKTIVVKDANGNATSEKIEDFLSTTYKKEAPFFYAGANGSGSGADATQEGGGGTGYDPVKAGKDAAASQKQGREQNQLAFK